MADKRAETRVPIHDLLARRWSGRAFDPDRPIKRAPLIALLEAARWSPSCYGDQPWRYIVWDRIRSELAWQRAFDCLSTGNQVWARNAPVLMLSLAMGRLSRNGKLNRWAQHDVGAASENLCLQAAAMGLLAHQMGGFDVGRVRESFAIPGECLPMAMIALGHPGPIQDLDAELRERELAVRSRLSLDECFFENRWGDSVSR